MPTYTNSPLVNYTRISPNRNSPRQNSSYNPSGKITGIAIHHMAGNLTVEGCGSVFAPSSRQASSNYGIGTDGRVGLYVPESDRSWATSSKQVDYNFVTIEVANCKGDPNWEVSDVAYNKLIELCYDICKRNGIAKLNYTGNKSGNLVMHKWYAATGCPGPYLSSKFPDIANKVNAKLAADNKPKEEPKMSYDEFKKFMARYEAEKAAAEESAWATPALDFVYNNGIMMGTKGTRDSLKPQSAITREEAAQMVTNTVKKYVDASKLK